jgi:hypothetical protein
VVVVCIGVFVYAGVNRLTTSHSSGIPSWLPKASAPVGRTVTASAARPQLAIEGDSVRVDLSHGQAMVTTVGPAVPATGLTPVPATTPCTFTVTFAAGRGSVPLAAAAFTIIDEQGRLHHPKVTTVSGGPLPASVPSGQTLALRLSDVLPTGNGDLRWTPEGTKPIVSWDFDVEID